MGLPSDADVAELVDALDLGSSAERRGGSSPFIRTSSLFLKDLTREPFRQFRKVGPQHAVITDRRNDPSDIRDK